MQREIQRNFRFNATVNMIEGAAFWFGAQREIQRNFRFNATVNMIEGAAFWFGASFTSAQTILPVYVSHFTDSKLLLGLLAALTSAGWLLPQLLTANWIQRLPRKKFAPVNVGLWTERLPVFLMAPAALTAIAHPLFAITAFYVLLAWQQIGIGFVALGWQDMIAKIMPVKRRGRFLGITTALGTTMGIAGASIAARLLQQHTFPYGYVYCFAAGAVLSFVSWFFLSLTREPAKENLAPPVSQKEFLRQLPSLLWRDANFRRYLAAQAIMNLSTMSIGFLAVYALHRWNLSDYQVSTYTISMLAGQSVSNLLFGALADRRGHKVVLEVSALVASLAMGCALLAPSYLSFHIVFVLIGSTAAGFYQSGVMIAMEFSKAEIRPTYMGLNNTVRGVSMGLAPLIGGFLVVTLGFQGLFVTGLVIALAGFATMHFAVQDPRRVAEGSPVLSEE